MGRDVEGRRRRGQSRRRRVEWIQRDMAEKIAGDAWRNREEWRELIVMGIKVRGRRRRGQPRRRRVECIQRDTREKNIAENTWRNREE